MYHCIAVLVCDRSNIQRKEIECAKRRLPDINDIQETLILRNNVSPCTSHRRLHPHNVSTSNHLLITWFVTLYLPTSPESCLSVSLLERLAFAPGHLLLLLRRPHRRLINPLRRLHLPLLLPAISPSLIIVWWRPITSTLHLNQHPLK